MTRKDALAAIGRGEGEARPVDEVARDIDWRKIRRVQHGLNLPRDAGIYREDDEVAKRGRRRATKLAHVLACLAGVTLGLAILRGLDSAPMLAAASLGFAFAAALFTHCGLQ